MVFRSINSIYLRLGLAALILSSASIYPHFFKAEKWSNATQDILLVSDFHRSTHKDNKCQKQQRQEIVDFAAKCGAGVIVEDGMIYGDALIKSPSVYMPQGVFPKSKLDHIEIEIPLHGLHSLCKLQGVDSTNVEYRFSLCRPLSVYYAFFNNKKDQILNNFKDGNVFETFYAQTIQQLQESIEKPLSQIFEQFKTLSYTLPEYLKQKNIPVIKEIDQLLKKIAPQWDTSLMTYAQKLEILLTNYTIAFLDMEIVHAIAVFKDKKTILICAGNHHIDNIKKLLPQLGFSQIKQEGNALRLSNGVKYIEPQAIQAYKTLDCLSPDATIQKPYYYYGPFINDVVIPLWGIYHA